MDVFKGVRSSRNESLEIFLRIDRFDQRLVGRSLVFRS